jgi:phage terminase small subunit
MGFADDKDMDNNNVPDVVQVMKLLLEEKPLSKATEVDAEGGAIEDGMDEQPFS